MIENTLNSDLQGSKTARLAAALFLFVGLPMALWAEIYVPGKIFVPQDPVATANNLLSNELIFRTSMFGHVVGIMLFVLMMLLFYRVFRPVDKHLSRLMIAPLLPMIPIVFVLEIFQFTAMMMLKGEPRPTFDVAQQQEVAYFLLRLQRYGVGATKIFLGLSFIPFGLLAYRSGYLPRIFGIFLIISGTGYLVDTSAFFLLDRPGFSMVRSVVMFTFLGFILTLIWFLVKGVRSPSQQAGESVSRLSS